MITVRVPGAASLATGESVAFDVTAAGERIDGFVLRHEGGLVAFRNRCPHWGVDLDLGLGYPVDPTSGLVLCRNHGALFRPGDGLCVVGPCAGDSLDRYALAIDGPDVIVTLESPGIEDDGGAERADPLLRR